MALGTVGAAQAQVTVPQRRTGLLNWDVVKDGPAHWQAGVQWDSVLTGEALHRGDLADVNVKTLGAVATGQGPSFYVYVGVDSQIIGGQDGEEVARKRLEAVETVGVEKALRDLILVPNATLVEPAANSQVGGLAAIEQYMAANYGGLPMLYASVADVVQGSRERNVLGSEDGRLYTSIGTPIAAGAGFLTGQGATIDGTLLGPSEFAVFASGYPTLYRSDINVVSAVATDTNRAIFIAERIYTAVLDGPIAASIVDRT